MEVLLFALFFISALIFFIAGKDDFGRTQRKLIINEVENIKEEDKVAEEAKKDDKVAEEAKKDDKVAEEAKKDDKVAEEAKKDDKVAFEGKSEPQEELKKES